MEFYLFDELKSEIYEYDESLMKNFPNIILIKDEQIGSIALENQNFGYVLKLSNIEEKELLKIVKEKDIVQNNINIYTPFLLLNFLEDKYGRAYILKLGSKIFYIKDSKIVIENEAFLVKQNFLEYFQKTNALFCWD